MCIQVIVVQLSIVTRSFCSSPQAGLSSWTTLLIILLISPSEICEVIWWNGVMAPTVLTGSSTKNKRTRKQTKKIPEATHFYFASNNQVLLTLSTKYFLKLTIWFINKECFKPPKSKLGTASYSTFTCNQVSLTL